jgi:hypothetical protein
MLSMKRFLQALVAFLLAALALPTVAGAVGLVKVDSSFAFANTTVLSADGCTLSTLNFGATDERTHEPPGPAARGSLLFINLSKFDVCTNTALFTHNGVHELADSAFQLSRPDDPATLRAAVDLTDDSGSPTTVSLVLDLTWEPVGQLFTGHFRSHSREGAMFVTGGGRQNIWDARLSGTAQDATTDYLAGDVFPVQLGTAKEGVLVVPQSMVSAVTAAGLSATSSPRRARTHGDVESAIAVWESFDSTGCIRSLGIVLAERSFELPRGSSEPVTTAYVELSRFDHCANQPLFFVQSDSPTPVPEEAFELKHNLSGATLSAVLPATDRVTGEPTTLDVDVVFNGVGDVIRQSSSQHSTSAGLTTTAHFSATGRAAAVEGSVYDRGIDLLSGFPVGPAHFLFAGLNEQRFSIATR